MNEALPVLTIPKGIVTVELFDAKTKRLLHRERKENFIALPAKERFAWVQMNEVANRMPSNIPNYFAPPDAFTTLFLNGDTSPESPSTERFVRNPIIGWANRKTPYAGSDPLRGTINASESAWDRTKAHYVFDFPTNAANGTIASVGFAGFSVEISSQGASFRKISSAPILSHSSFSSTNGLTLADNALCILDNNKVIHQIDPITGQETGSISISGLSSSTVYALAYGGGYFWVGDNNAGKIYKVNPDGTLNATITVSLPGITAMAYDNGYLWIYCFSGSTDSNTSRSYSQSLYKLTTTGTIASVIPIPSNVTSTSGGIDFAVDSSFIYFGTNLNAVLLWYPNYYVVDKSTGNLVAGFYANFPDSRSAGIETAGDGSIYTIKYFSSDSSQAEGLYLTKVYLGALGTRVLLGSPITKNNSQTLKVTYDLLYNLNPS